MCSSLVTNSRKFQTAQIGFGFGLNDATFLSVRLAHASVADYLTQPKPSSLSKFHFSKLEARMFFAQTCLVYLMHPPFAGGHDRLLVQKQLNEFPYVYVHF